MTFIREAVKIEKKVWNFLHFGFWTNSLTTSKAVLLILRMSICKILSYWSPCFPSCILLPHWAAHQYLTKVRFFLHLEGFFPSSSLFIQCFGRSESSMQKWMFRGELIFNYLWLFFDTNVHHSGTVQWRLKKFGQ